MALLEVKNCGIRFGGLKALEGLDFSLKPGEFLGMIGPNGAGKTTFFNLLTGVYTPSQGELVFQDRCLNPLKPQQICRLGIARTFQNIRLFPDLTVLENVLVALNQRINYGWREVLFATRSFDQKEKKILEEAEAWLEKFHLKSCQKELAKNLPYGDQRRLEIVRALVTKPRLLLLDEPAAGMNATEKSELVALIFKIHQEQGLAVILIEHDMSVVMRLCPRIIVLDYGHCIAEGSPEEIRQNPKVIEAYLGVEVDREEGTIAR